MLSALVWTLSVLITVYHFKAKWDKWDSIKRVSGDIF